MKKSALVLFIMIITLYPSLGKASQSVDKNFLQFLTPGLERLTDKGFKWSSIKKSSSDIVSYSFYPYYLKVGDSADLHIVANYNDGTSSFLDSWPWGYLFNHTFMESGTTADGSLQINEAFFTSKGPTIDTITGLKPGNVSVDAILLASNWGQLKKSPIVSGSIKVMLPIAPENSLLTPGPIPNSSILSVSTGATINFPVVLPPNYAGKTIQYLFNFIPSDGSSPVDGGINETIVDSNGFASPPFSADFMNQVYNRYLANLDDSGKYRYSKIQVQELVVETGESYTVFVQR